MHQNGNLYVWLKKLIQKSTHSRNAFADFFFWSITQGEMTNDEPQPLSNAGEIIVLSDDDTDEDNDSRVWPEQVMWFYECPKGQVHGPFSLKQLKEWNNAEYFDEILDFKVWMRGESIESAVLLTTLLPHVLHT